MGRRDPIVSEERKEERKPAKEKKLASTDSAMCRRNV